MYEQKSRIDLYTYVAGNIRLWQKENIEQQSICFQSVSDINR